MAGEQDIRCEMIALIPRMKRFALSLTRSAHDADDLLQLTFERAIRSIDSFEVGSRLDSWMYRIMQNLHRNSIRDRLTREKTVVGGVDGADVPVDGERAAHAHLEMTDVQRFMARLDEQHRSVLMLVAVEGYGYNEVAEMLSVPVGTVTSRLARARLKLRGFMETRTRTQQMGVGLQKVGGR